MAAPNIVNVSTITGITTGVALTTSTGTQLITNVASSGKVFKVNSIVVGNIDGSNACDLTLKLHDGSTAYTFVSTVSVPADTTLIPVDKNSAFYLQEGWTLQGGAGANSDLEAIITYEEIS